MSNLAFKEQVGLAFLEKVLFAGLVAIAGAMMKGYLDKRATTEAAVPVRSPPQSTRPREAT